MSAPEIDDASAADDAAVPPRNQLAFSGEGGLSAGLPVLGWGGTRFRYERRLGRQGLFAVHAELAAGPGLISPRLNAAVGYDLFRTRRVDWIWELYTGWPLLGVESRFEVRPLIFSHFEWSLGATGSGEMLWNVSGDVFTRVAVPTGSWTTSLRLAFEAGAGARSGAHLGPSAMLTLAHAFD